jgi:hypothetical protein
MEPYYAETECVLCGRILAMTKTNLIRHQKTKICKRNRVGHLKRTNKTDSDIALSAIEMYVELTKDGSNNVAMRRYGDDINVYVIERGTAK